MSDPLDDIAAAANAPQPAPDLRGDQPDPAVAFDVADLGDDCPIQPLGFLKKTNYFLDWAGQLIDLGSEFRKGELMQLFGLRVRWLENHWPQWKKGPKEGDPPIKDGFSQKDAQQGLILACAKRGIFDPKGKVRGRGAHLGDGGELLLHCGDQVLVGGRRGSRGQPLKSQWLKSGLIAGYVYPTAPALAHPAERPASGTVAAEILRLLDSWNWKRKTRVDLGGGFTVALDAWLLFCWMATAAIGGALKHRPHLWITGPSGAGKTTLQKLLRDVMDDWAIFTEDATEAGVRQLLDQDTLAVMFDEIEPDESNGEVHMKIVKLARLAYSGGSGLRGGQDHQSKQFVARSCFLFSSIHHHELPAQDRNRIAILDLSKFPPKTPQLRLPLMLKEWGSELRRRLVEQWPRYEATLLSYQREMLEQSYAGREQDTYGTLLACGDLLIHDAAPDLGAQPRIAEMVRKLVHVLDAVRAESEDTTERCLGHISSHRLPAKSGEEQQTIARWLTRRTVELILDRGQHGPRDKLATHGMKLVNLQSDHAHGNGQGGIPEADMFTPESLYVAIANKAHDGAKELFKGTLWEAGIWPQSLQLVAGAFGNKKARFGGSNSFSCTIVPLAELIDVEAAYAEARKIREEASF